MATRDKIKQFLDLQISNDAKARRQLAGDKWTTLQMDFFYGVGNDISVDIAVKSAMLGLLAEVHELLPNEEWAGLRHDINSTTVVDGAIDRMQSASLRSTDQLG
jgi:ribosomal protein S13